MAGSSLSSQSHLLAVEIRRYLDVLLHNSLPINTALWAVIFSLAVILWWAEPIRDEEQVAMTSQHYTAYQDG